MSDLTRRTVLATMAAAGVVTAVGAREAAAADSLTPFTVPAMQSWTPGSGSFALSPAPAVVVNAAAFATLGAAGADLAADLTQMLGTPVRLITNSGSPGLGQIGLTLVPSDPTLGSEGYSLEVGSALTIRASSRAGAVHGAQTVIQLLAQGTQIPRGSARDWPAYPERGLMIDIGRKPAWDAAWLHARIREMALLKMNRVHLHFTDDLGWRIECSVPGVQSDVCLSKAEVRALVAYADRYGVVVVPEIDLPGHFTAAIRNYPQFQLVNVAGQANAACLDYTNPAARAFAAQLVREYLDLFPGPTFHLGGDEFMPQAEIALYPSLTTYAISRYGLGATMKDGYLGFLNELNEVVRGSGRTTHVWNDYLGGGNRVQLDRSIAVEWWTDNDPLGDLVGIPTPQDLIAAGHSVVNCSWLPTYFSTASAPPPPDITFTYERWSVNQFHGPVYYNADIGTPWYNLAPRQPGLLGSKLHIWGDANAGTTPAQDAVAIAPWLRVFAQQTWESPHIASTYAGFEADCTPVVAAEARLG